MIRAAILTVSDSVCAGTREDLSGPALKNRCEKLGWPVTAAAAVPDDTQRIVDQLTSWTDNDAASLILTTGGTGVSARDNTPEATRAVIERELPGISELMRVKGIEQTRFAVLSRGLAGTRGRTLIVNLPGAPSGAIYSFHLIEDLVPHAVNLLIGDTEHRSHRNA